MLRDIFFAILILSLLGFLIGCSENIIRPDASDNNTVDQPVTPERDLTAAEKAVAGAADKFGCALFGQINNGRQNANLFISPLSVSIALGMAYNGAAGETREAIQNTLALSGLTIQEVNESYKSLAEYLTGLDPTVTMEIANSMWYRLGLTLKDDFIDLNTTYFDAEVSELDFSDPGAADIINAWVYDKTHGKIEDIVTPPINPATMLFLINAVYFYGGWTYQFDPNLTEKDNFVLANGDKIECEMMSQKALLPYLKKEQFVAVDLPYGDGKFAMAVFLPAWDVHVDELADLFNETSWNQWAESFVEDSVNIFLPKFELTDELRLKDALKAMGMGITFDPSRADFSNISGQANLCISNVKHKTYVKVDEEGTEAAAVTSIEFTITSDNPHEKYVRVDRPFIFVIHETQANTILFIGKVMNPIP
jgi:serpin B